MPTEQIVRAFFGGSASELAAGATTTRGSSAQTGNLLIVG